jgi:GAF domain-containing protein
MERGRGLTNADRCSIFLLNESKERLITYLQSGLESPINIPTDTGIAGHCVTEQTVVNVADAYDFQYFDSSTDRDRGYRTKSVVAVPIYNAQGDVIGCTEFINKLTDESFSDWDVKVIQLFNVFCGISLENSRLFQESKDMHDRMSNMLETAFSLCKSEEIHAMLSNILQNAKALVGADRASVFTLEPNAKEFAVLFVDGDGLPATFSIDHCLAGLAAKTKKPIIENDCYMNSDFSPSIDRRSGYHTNSLIALPLLDSKSGVIGVVEFLNKPGGFTPTDMLTVSAFAAFASFALQNSRTKSVAKAQGIEIEMMKWITPEERDGFEIPASLVLTEP